MIVHDTGHFKHSTCGPSLAGSRASQPNLLSLKIYMKRLLLTVLVASLPMAARAGTTIDPANHYAYGANLGWMDWRGDTANGAVIGEYVCSGYIYSANTGWINLGSGSPPGGIYYSNTSAADWGVNQDGLGNLRGYAWGANIGWINFEATGTPKVDLLTGNFSGSVWSANCGWISLSNAMAYVQTDTIQPGPLAPDGLPIPWLLANFGTTNVDANADPDHDGQSNRDEYLTGTNPNNASDCLCITNFTRNAAGYNLMAWQSVPTRYYYIQRASVLNDPAHPFLDTLIYWGPGWHSTGFFDSGDPTVFYRIRAFRPLMP